MSSFFSNTDDRDDISGIRYSGVFGHLDKPVASTVWRFNYMKQKIECKLEDIFEMRPQDEVTIPADWMSKVRIAQELPAPARGYSTKHKSEDADAEKTTYGKWSYENSLRSDSAGYRPNGYFDRSARNRNSDLYSDAFDSDFWAMGSDSGLPDDSLGRMIQRANADMYGDSLVEAAERHVADQAMVEEELPEDPVGSHDGLYEVICYEHGADVADAYHDIDSSYMELDGKDELLVELATAMMDLVKDPEEKMKALRRIYDSMESRQREVIETNGF